MRQNPAAGKYDHTEEIQNALNECGGDGTIHEVAQAVCGRDSASFTANGHLCVNAVSFGFDSAVCKMMQKIKRYPLIGGKNAYYVGAFLALFYAMRTKCRIFADGEEIAAKEILLCTVANGRYVGGSFKCAPRSLNDDGLLEVCCVKPIFPLRFFPLIGPYSKGEQLKARRFRKIVTYRQSKKIEISAPGDF